jgi:hypothetical protein
LPKTNAIKHTKHIFIYTVQEKRVSKVTKYTPQQVITNEHDISEKERDIEIHNEKKRSDGTVQD